jgi:uncharacterized membrane protein (DUF485 family)
MPELIVPPPSSEPRDRAVERYNARLGLRLFGLYLAVYAAFVAVNAFWPALMDIVVWAGLNLAVVSGLGLIVGAFVLSLVYAGCCKAPAGSRA